MCVCMSVEVLCVYECVCVSVCVCMSVEVLYVCVYVS